MGSVDEDTVAAWCPLLGLLAPDQVPCHHEDNDNSDVTTSTTQIC